MPLPPWSEVWDALRLVLAPAFGASLLVMLAVRLLAGERCAPLASALAVAAGVFAGNYFGGAFPWRIDSDRPLDTSDLRLVLGWSLEGKPPPKDSEDAAPIDNPDPIENPPRAWYWLPWLAGLALSIDLLVRLPGIPNNVGWVMRTLVAVLAGRLLTLPALRVEAPWASWLMSLTILVEWVVLCALARQWKDGTVAAAMALCLAAAGIVALHAHFARLNYTAILFFAALTGIAAVAWRWPSDTGPALAAAAVVLPGLLLNANQETDSNVPERSFIFAGLAPLACLPLFLPFLARQQRWRRWIPAMILPLFFSTFAVILAARAEKAF